MRGLQPWNNTEDLEAVRQRVAREMTREDAQRRRRDANDVLLGAALTAVDVFLASAPDLRIDAAGREQIAAALVATATRLSR